MSGLRLLTLGVGDAFSARYYSSCLALEAAGAWLLLDCPHPIRKIAREAGEAAGVVLDIGQLAGVVLSHLHADHSSGLEGLAYFARFRANRLMPLLAHPQVLARLWDGHLAGSMEWTAGPDGTPERHQLEEYFDVRPLTEEHAVEVGPFRIECRLTVHSIPATAFRVHGDGRSLGYSADTAFDPGLIEWLSTADLVVHEAGSGFMHTPYEQLAQLPAALRSRMRIVHYPDNFDLTTSAIEPLRQGRSYPV